MHADTKQTANTPRATLSWRKSLLLFLGGSIFGVAVMLLIQAIPRSTGPISQTIRLSDAKTPFISPLLACGINQTPLAPQFQPLQKSLEKIVAELTKSGALEKASIYFKDLQSGQWIDVGPQEKFYTASLGKIPIMIAYFKIAETNPRVLEEKIHYAGGNDLNLQQEIKPQNPITPGQTYTVLELIEHMIKYSDNNAANLLTSNMDQGILNNVYDDLGVPILNNVTTENLDFMTTNTFSLFFRVLYNATYLSREYSEKALEILSGTDFDKGLLAGIPKNISVSHKFGLTSIENNLNISERELHECGIVYYPEHPYFVCVMTRSASSLPTIESSIARISSAIYQSVASEVSE